MQGGKPRRLGMALAVAVAVCIGALLAIRAFTPRALGPTPAPNPRSPGSAARIPMIDLHVHASTQGVPRLLQLMQRYGVESAVNLSGGSPLGELEQQLAAAKPYPDKLIVFTTLAYEQVQFTDFGERMAALVRIAHEQGARGLKIAKVLGLGLRTRDRVLIGVDDARLDPVFETAGELGMPVAIHTGDPRAFWLAVDANNPRRDELEAHPGWALYGRRVPSFEALLGQLERRIARHPNTKFISVHFGNCAEDPEYVARALRRYPNLYIDTAARIPEFGRHSPERMRQFFIEFADRILYGSDLGVGPEPTPLFLGSEGAEPSTDADRERFFAATRRYFETLDRDFDHPTPIQGNWKINGIGLPPDVLRKVYHDNAVKLLRLDRALLGAERAQPAPAEPKSTTSEGR
jgi:predicted TIM-barrel fold metal-dependent hydrolase